MRELGDVSCSDEMQGIGIEQPLFVEPREVDAYADDFGCTIAGAEPAVHEVGKPSSHVGSRNIIQGKLVRFEPPMECANGVSVSEHGVLFSGRSKILKKSKGVVVEWYFPVVGLEAVGIKWNVPLIVQPIQISKQASSGVVLGFLFNRSFGKIAQETLDVFRRQARKCNAVSAQPTVKGGQRQPCTFTGASPIVEKADGRVGQLYILGPALGPKPIGIKPDEILEVEPIQITEKRALIYGFCGCGQILIQKHRQEASGMFGTQPRQRKLLCLEKAVKSALHRGVVCVLVC